MSLERFFLLEKCPTCSKSTNLNWKYCEACGSYLDQEGPRVTKTKAFYKSKSKDKALPPKENLRRKVTKDLHEKMNTSIEGFLYQGDDVKSEIFFPILMMAGKDSYEVKKLKEEITLNSLVFSKDLQGYFFQVLSNEEVFYNGLEVKDREKHYLLEGDTIYTKDNFFVYSVLNQEEVGWKRKEKEELVKEFDELSIKDAILQISPTSDEVRVNNQNITKDTLLREGSVFSMGGRKGVVFKEGVYLQDPLEPHHHESLATSINKSGDSKSLHIGIDYRDVDLGRGGQKRILEDINLDIEAGTFVLILGGSGAGKTTLINAITGREKAVGRILFGDENLYDDYDSMKRLIALVPQFNLHRAHDTVFMTLKNAGQMKLPKAFIENESLLDEHVLRVLEKVNLLKAKDSLVSKLSGGEQKRLSIATEYIADPVIFILDEPDSGLDGSNARAIMNSLRSIADDKKIVLLISHSPDRTSHLFDKVLVLAKSQTRNCGSLAFYGDVKECLEYFGVEELELVVEKIEEDGDFYIEKFKNLGES